MFWVGQQTNWPISFVLLYQNKRLDGSSHSTLKFVFSRNSIQNSWKWVTWTKKTRRKKSIFVEACMRWQQNVPYVFQKVRQQIKQSDLVTLSNQKAISVANCWFHFSSPLKNMFNSNVGGPLWPTQICSSQMAADFFQFSCFLWIITNHSICGYALHCIVVFSSFHLPASFPPLSVLPLLWFLMQYAHSLASFALTLAPKHLMVKDEKMIICSLDQRCEIRGEKWEKESSPVLS